MQTHQTHLRPIHRPWTHTLVSGALAFSFLLPCGVMAQEKPMVAERNALPNPTITLTGDEVPSYLVTAHFYDYLLSALAEGHGTWTRYVLTPLGLEPDTQAEAELETFLLEVRDTVTSSLHVAYNSKLEPERFQQDQLRFRLQKMGAMAVVHAQLIQLLESSGIGTKGLFELMEQGIRPWITVSISSDLEKSLGERRSRELSIFGYFDDAFEAAKVGAELPSSARLQQKSSSTGDVISLTGWPQFPNCGNGLLSRRGWHNLKLVVKDQATTLSLTGRLKECGPYCGFVGAACSKAAAATASGQTITCYSSAGDTLCQSMPKHSSWQRAYVYSNATTLITETDETVCTKPDRCDDFYPPQQ